ncbi:Leucine-rich repeat-containing protein 15-like protein [Leptotrombidium deliense]|uniref:Leucine-rich repeat-containing protein 15-like protein n=1 Tax=Leptotrombidium deliense TaxID=299467 RepID=A0A443SFX9_9ACAR|nr:Leucine-rich repeat-containing protein 15-like protein [Leptotrombidium deliense]
MFSNVPVDTFHLENNGIRKIEEYAFRGSERSMKKLFLNKNFLQYFPFNEFHEYTALEILNLNHNHIEGIPKNAFQNSSLRRLNVAANKIEKIGKNAFSAAVNLEFIDFSDNDLRSKMMRFHLRI